MNSRIRWARGTKTPLGLAMERPSGELALDVVLPDPSYLTSLGI